MRRLRGDTGSVAIVVAVSMIMVIAMAALVVDGGSGYVRGRQLQNAADAAVLAIAQDCAGGACGNITSTATSYAQSNVGSGSVSASPSVSSGTATVITSSTVDFTFAPGSKVVTRSATARWGSPIGGTALLPIGFSWCAFKAQTGGGVPTGTTATTILLPKTDATACTGPTGNPVPGGFAWLAGANCSATTSIATAQTPGDPGRSPAGSGCTAADIAALQNKTLILPLYDKFGGTGSGAWYHVYAYAAFKLTGYNFGGQYKWNSQCTGNDTCITGLFTKMVAPSDAFTYGTGAPDLGARVFTLTN